MNEEEDFVPIDMSRGRGCEIITDPEAIRLLEDERVFRAKFRSVKNLPLNEPWFTPRPASEVEHLLLNTYHIDGYFLVTPDMKETNIIAFTLNVMFNETLHQFRITQVNHFVTLFLSSHTHTKLFFFSA